MNFDPIINDVSKLFCTFEDTGSLYNNRKVYKCKYCNIQLALDNPLTKVMCFAKKKELDEILNPHAPKPIDGITDPNQIMQIATQQMFDKGNITEDTFNTNANVGPTDSGMCTKEQIDARMTICQSCEYFKENSCLLCGCSVVRERAYNNKLAKKSQHCPIFKWKAITD